MVVDDSGVMRKIIARGLSSLWVDEVVEEMAALAEDASDHARNGEDELAVRDGLAEGFGDPVAGGADASLVAGRAEVATLAGESEESFVAAVGIRALKASETGSEVAALVEVIYCFDGEGAEWAVDLAVFGFVFAEGVVPRMVDGLP